MEREEFRAKLREISYYENKPWGRIEFLASAEQQFEADVEGSLGGFMDLSNASTCFFLETVERINKDCRPHVQSALSEFYPIFMSRLVQNFRSLCGAQKLALSGYPLHAFTILRNTFDDAILTSACLQGFSDFYSIEGIIQGIKIEMVEVKKLRKNTERDVLNKFIWSCIHLSELTKTELRALDQIFDFEVHGARLSFAGTKGWLLGKESLGVLPNFNQKEFSMYMNRACEIGWMIHRFIPLVQPPKIPLSNDWKNKWLLIDESYQKSVESLSIDLGKPIGNAIKELVTMKFPFSCDSEFPLP
jgi:hypothetical protein